MAVAVAYLVYLDVAALAFLLKDKMIPMGQRAFQAAFVILVPLIGAVVSLHLNFADDPKVIRFVPWPLKNAVRGKPVKRYEPVRESDTRDLDVFH